MRTLGEDLFLIADVFTCLFAIVGLASMLWMWVFPPTIHGLLPGCLGMIGAIPIIACLPLPLEAVGATLIVHANGHDFNWLSQRCEADRERILLPIAFINLPLGLFLAMLLDKLVVRINRLLRRIEDDACFVGLNYNSLFRRRFVGETISIKTMLCREMLRGAVLAVGVAVPMMTISYEAMYRHPSLTVLWMLVGCLTVISVMYLIYGTKTLVRYSLLDVY